jgi:hypothetical protein
LWTTFVYHRALAKDLILSIQIEFVALFGRAGGESVRLIGFRSRSPPFAYVSFSPVNIAHSFVQDCRSPFRFAPIRDILGDRFGDRMEINDGMAGNLTALKVQRAKPGKYSDGGNL